MPDRKYLKLEFRRIDDASPILLVTEAAGNEHSCRADVQEHRGELRFGLLDRQFGQEERHLRAIIAAADELENALPAMLDCIRKTSAEARAKLAKLPQMPPRTNRPSSPFGPPVGT